MCRDETRRGRTRSPFAAGRNQPKVTTKATMKPKEKADDKDRDKNDNKKNTIEAQCLPATGKSDQTGKQTKAPNTEKANAKKLKKKPCHNRHTIQISPCLGSAPRCRASRWAQYSSSERCPSSRDSFNTRRSASNTTSWHSA